MGDYGNLSSCWTSVFSSLKFLLVVVTLILVSGFVFMLGPKISPFPLSYNPWIWRTGAPLSSSTATGPTNSSLEVEEETERHLDFHPRVVDTNHLTEIQEALSEAPSFNPPPPPSSSSSSPPLASQILLTVAPSPQPNDKERQEDIRTSRKESDIASLITKVPKVQSRLERLEAGLARARAAIKDAVRTWNQTTDPDYVPQGPMYWKPHAFHKSYIEMEKQLKVFIYEEGEPPLFHNGPCKSIYSMEGNFIHRMEMDGQFRTRDPEKAHLFFLPFSVTMMVRFVYVPNSHDIGPIKKTIIDYVDVISTKYPFWNRSLGADHFMLSCHDWGPISSTYVPNMYKNSIRVLCNANTSEGFNPTKDASFPEIHLKTGLMNGLVGGPSLSGRPILGFFAGGMHGPVRPVLLEHWKNKDEDLQVFEYLPKGMSYEDKMRKSKFCLCPSGYEVASPRIVEAIYAGCVPVLISDHYVPPFGDVLNWKTFSVEVPVGEIPNLKRILMGISWRQYIRMQRRLIQVRRHFEVHSPPKRFDVYNMILHSIWLRRLNVHIRDL